MRRPATTIVLSFVMALSACSSSCATKQKEPEKAPKPAAGNEVALFISADLRGYLGPCGCSENMRGGIARTAYEVESAKKSGVPVAYLDAGDSLFRFMKPTAAQVPQEARKARAIAESFKAMGIFARGSGDRDLVQGEQFRDQLGLPNVPSGGEKVETVGGHKLALVAGENKEQVKAATEKARAAGAEFVVAAVHAPLEQVQAMAEDASLGPDLLVAAHAEELQGEDNRLLRAAIPLAQVQSKGRSLLRADLTFGGEGRFELLKGQAEQDRELKALDERIELLRAQVNEPMLKKELLDLRKAKLEELLKRRETLASVKPQVPPGKNAFTLRFIPLETTVPDDPKVAQIVSAYDKDVGELNLKFAKEHNEVCAQPTKGQPRYVGSEACRDCHEESFPVWEATKHVSAYKTLEQKNKQYHLDCVGCHVTGWQRPGGTCRIDQVTNFTNVGCESCHGPGSNHVEDPDEGNIKLGNDEQTCTGCHDPENSPHFDFEAYLPKILGKGHEAHAKK